MTAFAHTPSLVLAAALKPVARALLVLPDGAIAGLFAGAAAVAPGDTAALLRELAGVFRAGPPGTAVVRRMLAQSRTEELADYLWGALFFKRSGGG